MTVTCTPYRGKLEPVTEIRKSEVAFHENYVECIISYDYVEFTEERTGPNDYSIAYLIPREGITVMRSYTYHELDQDREQCPVVIVSAPGLEDAAWMRCKTNKEADTLYSAFRNYVLAQ